ncbi:hypothetical protein ETD86_45595 [Nonomuraea turkmeniaca]|uniref:Uncharacterized protein n=1 Tax=Nonomuraea turkmeniaca TaxID=103838 RepID=A0A5S4EZD5_9ACTN|nr:hypothetical protein [Nonomuraea turkmeniaca]TMR08951.1 hypothetical protein ETD86_45595 [Nonomuraea turkmeniaca]
MHDPAVPGALLSASADNGARARAFDGTVTTLRTATAGLASGALVGPCATRFLTTLDGLQAAFVTARAAHEEIADALRRTVAPIEEEQQARDRLEKAERLLAEARQRLAGLPDSADPATLAQAKHAVEEAEQDVRQARRRHEEAVRERARAVRGLAVACQGAAVLGALPAPPGEVVVGPRLHDALREKGMRPWRRTSRGRGLTPQELRRLRRNGLSPATPLASLVYGKYGKDGALLDEPWRLGPVDGRVALGHRAFEVSGGVGRMGDRYGVRGDFRAEAYALSADARLRRKLGPADVAANASARAIGADASAGGEVSAGPGGVRVRAEAGAFAGVKAGVDGSVEVAGVKPSAGLEGQAGVSASAGVDFGFHDGKLKLAASVGAALGLGGKVTGGMEIDVGKLAGGAGDAANAVAGGAGDAAKAVTGAPGNAVKAIKGLL